MDNLNRKNHWEHIYNTKEFTDVSWYQAIPTISLEFVHESGIAKNAKIIDVGGGDSFFADQLLELGFKDITVLDISKKALEKAQKRLGENSCKIKWIECDAAAFAPTEKYDFWHDRAAFHFLTNSADIQNYVATVSENINPNGILVIGTFSENGPKKCSGIEITQYSEEKLTELFLNDFVKIKSVNIDHQTPFNTVQNFVFCSFRKK